MMYLVNDSWVDTWEGAREHILAGTLKRIVSSESSAASELFGQEYSDYQQGFDVRESYADATDWFLRLATLHGEHDSITQGVVLDLGCGPGWLQRAFAEREGAPKTIGVEVNAAALAYNSYPSMLYDGLRLPFPDDALQGVMSMTVLEHLAVPNILALVHESMRVAPFAVHSLEPDGPTFAKDPTHVTRKSEAEWLELLRSTGYHVDYVDVGLRWVATYVVRRSAP